MKACCSKATIARMLPHVSPVLRSQVAAHIANIECRLPTCRFRADGHSRHRTISREYRMYLFTGPSCWNSKAEDSDRQCALSVVGTPVCLVVGKERMYRFRRYSFQGGTPSAYPSRRIVVIIECLQKSHQMQCRSPHSTKMKNLM